MAYATINNPSANFTLKQYTGNGTDNTAITNDASAGNFKPDLLWIKETISSAPSSHRLFDSNRGASKRIESDTQSAQATDTSNQKSFDTNGFTLGDSSSVNANGDTYIAAQWKANGGTTSSNASGDITSTVQANTAAGFSIVTWTGNGGGVNVNIGHGLGDVPEIVAVKNCSDSVNWRIGISNKIKGQGGTGRDMAAANGDFMQWDTTDASTNPGATVIWGSPQNPTSSVFTVGSDNSVNGNGDTMLAYCWRSIRGYSQCGTYIGNADGGAGAPFIYTGFRPAYIMIKPMDNVSSWSWHDVVRSPHNESQEYLWYNSSNVQGTRAAFDIVSNGFKIRTTDNDYNYNSGYMLYYAVADMPLVATNDVFALAR